MPLPAVLGPDTTELPIMAILIDPGNCFEEVEDLSTLGNLLVYSEDILVGHPLVRTKATIGKLGTRAEQFIVSILFHAIIEDFNDRFDWGVDGWDRIHVVIVRLINFDVYQFGCVARISGLIRAETTVSERVSFSFGSGVSFNHLEFFLCVLK